MLDIRVPMMAAILLFSGLAGATAAYSAAANDEATVDATVTIVHEQPIDLVGTDITGETVTYNGSTINSGDDYVIDESRGHIYFLEDGVTEEGETAEINYTAEVPERLAEQIRGPMGNATVIAGAGVFVMLVFVVVSAIGTLRGGRY